MNAALSGPSSANGGVIIGVEGVIRSAAAVTGLGIASSRLLSYRVSAASADLPAANCNALWVMPLPDPCHRSTGELPTSKWTVER
jgi:hypothetical protein